MTYYPVPPPAQAYPPQYAVAARRTNGWGIAGFVVSLVAYLTCGLLSPIAALLSFIGVLRAPRGLAIAGLILSLPPILVWGALLTVGRPYAVTYFRVGLDGYAIQQYAGAHSGMVPRDSTWQQVVARAGGKSVDAWGQPLQYDVRSDTDFDIRSVGPDGVVNTYDDIAFSKFRDEMP